MQQEISQMIQPKEFYIPQHLAKDNPDMCILVHLNSVTFKENEGFNGYILVNNFLNEIIKVDIKLKRSEQLFFQREFTADNNIIFEFPNYTIIEGDPMKYQKIVFNYYLPPFMFTPTAANKFYII
ncbi:hypothetical protein HZS_48, partial [Henneguya salminicola]